MKKIMLTVIAATMIIMTGSMDFSIRTVYADNLVDINVSSSGRRRSHHSNNEEISEKEREIELSRANIEAQEEALRLMQTVQVEQVPEVQNPEMPPVQEEPVEKKSKKKSKKEGAPITGSSKGSEEPKTAGSDLPIVPFAMMLFFTDMLIVVVESAGDFDDLIRRDHIEKLVEKYKKGGKWTRILTRMEISLCIFYSRLKARSDRNLKNRREKCSAA